MNNDRGLLSGSITILIGAVIAIMALVRGPWQVWLLLGVFTLWGLWVVLILLLPYMQQAILCMADQLGAFDQNNLIVPISLI